MDLLTLFERAVCKETLVIQTTDMPLFLPPAALEVLLCCVWGEPFASQLLWTVVYLRVRSHEFLF